MAVALPLVSLSVRTLGVFRTKRWLESASPKAGFRSATEVELQDAERLASLAEIVGRRGAVSATCLRQSLLVYFLLRRRGLAPILQLGVRKNSETLDGHAWIDLDATPLGQRRIEHMVFEQIGRGAS